MRFLISSLALLAASLALTADAAPFANTVYTVKLRKEDLPDKYSWKQRWNINMHRVLNRMEDNIRSYVESGEIPEPFLGSVDRYLSHGVTDDVDVNEYGDIFDADKAYGMLDKYNPFSGDTFGLNVDKGKRPCNNKGKSKGDKREGSPADESGSSGEPAPPQTGHKADKPEEPKDGEGRKGTEEQPQTGNPEEPKDGNGQEEGSAGHNETETDTPGNGGTSNGDDGNGHEGGNAGHNETETDTTGNGTSNAGDGNGQEGNTGHNETETDTTSNGTSNAGDGNAGHNETETDTASNGTSNAGDNGSSNGNSQDLEGQDNDLGYFGELEISGQKFNVIFDTGSADLWVPHPECPDSACKSHKSFDFTKSKTFKASEQNFAITFGSGSVAGDVDEDDVSVAGVVAKGQKFGLARTMSVQFNGAPFDGIMGMALDKRSKMKATMTFNTMVNQGSVKEPVFSFALGREKDNSESQLTLGGVDATKFKGELRFQKVVGDDGFWKVAMDTALVNGRPVGIQARRASIDTGTSLLITTPEDARLIHRAIDGAIEEKGQFFVPCDTKAVVSLQFGGARYDIDPRDLSREPINRDNLCVSGISGVVIGGKDEWLVGDVFLKNVYSAYNVKTLEVGFAQLA